MQGRSRIGARKVKGGAIHVTEEIIQGKKKEHGGSGALHVTLSLIMRRREEGKGEYELIGGGRNQ